MTYSPVTLESLLTHRNWAMRVARRLVREEGEAEDLVQRTWMAALRSPPQSQLGAKAWIRKVILNLARERHRRNQARVRTESSRAGAEEGAAAADAFESVSRAEIHRLLSERLMQLAEPYRTVVLQRFYEDLTSVEIAQRLGIPAGTVRWRLKIGLDHLREELDRRSKGDRTRWVSALLAFGRPFAPRGSESAEESAAPASSSVASAALVWTALGATGLLGFFFLRGAFEPAGAEVVAAAGVAEREFEAPPRTESRARAAGAGERVPAAALAAEERGVRAEDPLGHDGLALLVLTPEGEPVPDAAIHVALSDGHALRTHSDGEGRAWLVPEPGDVGGLGLVATRGRLSVRAIAAGHAASDLVHVAAPFTPGHVVRLTVGGPDWVLQGRVRTPEGAPVPDALVACFLAKGSLEVRPEGDFSSTTYVSVRSDADGQFVLPNLSGQGEIVTCIAPGFALFTQNGDAIDRRPLEIVLDRGATIVGTVRNPNGAPAAGILVALESICKTKEWATGLPGYDANRLGFFERARTDELGRFRLEGVSAGRVRTLWALDEERGLAASTALRLASGSEVVWDAELAQRPQLDLRLVDEHGQPLAGLLADVRRPVEGSWWARRIHTDDEGRVTILDCPAGPLFLDLLPALGAGASLGWRLLQPSDELQTIVFDSRRLITIRGRLLDPFGAPETRGDLIALSMDTSLETRVARAADGRFEQRLPPGTYVFLLRVGQTAGKLGGARCRAGSVRDLGDLITPPSGNLLLEAGPAQADQPASYSLFRIGEEGEADGSLLLGQGWLRESVSLAMFPGRYHILLFPGDGGPMQSYTARVGANEETRLQTR